MQSSHRIGVTQLYAAPAAMHRLAEDVTDDVQA